MEHSISLPRQNIISQVLWIALLAALTAIGAQIQIFNQPVPFTLQTFFVLLSGAYLGKRNGAISQFAYLLVGVCGLPVFAGFGFGIMRLLGPSGGYLLSFPVAAFVVGYILSNKSDFLRSIIAMSLGMLVIFSAGVIQLYAVYFHNWAQAITNGVVVFSMWDVVKIVAAASIYSKLNRHSFSE
jgi:biotin transport system substrate-specific component